MSSLRYDEISKRLAQRLGEFPGNSTFGQSFYDQYRNANSGLGYLRSIENEVIPSDRGQYDNLVSGVKGLKGSAIAGGAIAGLTAGAQILNNATQAAQLEDTTQFENQLTDLSRVGSYGYNNFDEIARDYSRTNFNPSISYDDIRGMSTGEKIGNVGSSALSGAAAGMQIGGPWGAAIGGVIGAGAGLAGILTGDRAASVKETFLNNQADIAAGMAQDNLNAAHERILNRNDRRGVVHAVAKGGQIERKSESIKAYADRVLSKPRVNNSKCGGRITRSYCDGGVKYRVRVK